MLKALPIHPSLLHPLTGQPLRAIGTRPDGSPLWPIMGGSGEGDDANDADDDKSDDADDSGSDADDDKSDDAETDWKAKYEAQQRVNRSLERKARKDAGTIQRLTGKKPEGGGKKDDGDQPDLEQIKADAKAEAAREVLHARIEDKIEAKARAFADPEDAVAVLLRSSNIEDFLDNDKIDIEAIADALKELGEKKPHLLAQGGKKFEGDADQGTRKESKGRPKNLGDAIARSYDDKR